MPPGISIQKLGANFLCHYGLRVDIQHRSQKDSTTSFSSPRKIWTCLNTQHSFRYFWGRCRSTYSRPASKYRNIGADCSISQLVKQKEFEDIIKRVICRPSNSFRSPPHTPSGLITQWRPYRDDLSLNVQTISDRYPILLIQDFEQTVFFSPP